VHATVLVVRNFLDDLTLWGWAERPAGQLLFAADVPRLPRALPHPRHDRPTDFLFCEHGRQLRPWRIRKGLDQAVLAAGLTGPDGTPLRVVPHQLRHTFSTTLVNAGMSLQALMALLGHAASRLGTFFAVGPIIGGGAVWLAGASAGQQQGLGVVLRGRSRLRPGDRVVCAAWCCHRCSPLVQAPQPR
jgi:hypothetical protein